MSIQSIPLFSPSQLAQFQQNGFLAVPHFWNPDEIAAMRAELERLKNEGLLRNVATQNDGETASDQKANLQLCPMSPHSPLFRAMPFAPRVVVAIEQLIGGPVVLQLDQVFLKPAHHGAGTNWHQDNHYFGVEKPTTATALWTAVHDATMQNGTMRVIPRAFETMLEHRRDPDSNHHFRCFPDESSQEIIEIEAGGALFFNYGTPHATGPNLTNSERAGVALHFLNEESNRSARGGLGKRPYLSGPQATGGESEYGERVDWEAQVRQTLRDAA